MRRGVLDVSWAPNVGRSFHLIASCGRDGILRVSKLKRIRKNHEHTDAMDTSSAGATQSVVGYEFESSQVLETDTCEVWKCAWNITGTVLAASGDFGTVSLWKADYQNRWKCVSEMDDKIQVS
jgi:nucleoporin SEH1